MKEELKQFKKLFTGLDRAYGIYKTSGKTSAKGKAQGKASTIQEPVTEELYLKHLKGEQGLGIVPIMDNNMCWFAVIDVDIYNLDLKELYKRIKKLKLPLILCRSKSGGAHLYLFLKQLMSAIELRPILMQWATMLGYPGVEIFPKQDTLAGQEDVGNWINLPYYDAERTTRYALFGDKSILLKQFLNKAHKLRQDPNKLCALPEQAKGAPPCLQALFTIGFPEGSMNNGLLDCGVYAKKRWPDDWQAKVAEYNNEYFRGTVAEVRSIIRAIGTKDYFYMCKQEPIKQYCDKILCSKAEFGIGNNDDNGLEIESLSKICSEPPIWIVQIGGKRIQMSTDDLLNQPRFSKRCVEVLTILPFSLKNDKWVSFIRVMLSEARLIEAPKDAGTSGQFLYHLEQFCMNKAPANSKDEILLGKPWHEEGKTYFRAADLFKYLEQQRFRDLKPHQMYTIMHQIIGVDKDFISLKGCGVNVWIIPSFNQQVEDFETPKIDKEEF